MAAAFPRADPVRVVLDSVAIEELPQRLPSARLPADDQPPTPTAVDIFGGEIVPFPKPPRELAERYFNVVAWAEHESGGHFPAVAEPQLLARRLRDVFQPYRGLPGSAASVSP